MTTIRETTPGDLVTQRLLSEPLKANEIDFRVQSVANRPVYKGWAVCAIIVAYKDARCDMNRLDQVFGYAGWQRLHKDLNGMLFGGVLVRDETGEWVEKWDVGEPSNQHAEKGLASDSFKRACFNLGIGRELYTYPRILVPLYPNEFTELNNNGKKSYKQTYDLNIGEWVWFNQFNDDNELTYLAAKQLVGSKFNLRYEWGSYTPHKSIETIETPREVAVR